jgi:small subunit ribosomal protein S1
MSSVSNPWAWEEPLEEAYWKVLLGEENTCITDTPTDGYEPLDDLTDLERTDGQPEAPADSAAAGDTTPISDWELAQQKMDDCEILELPITGYNRGGLLVKFHGLQGFLPASHLLDLPRGKEGEERLAELANRVGETLPLRIIELDEERNRLILSQRSAAGNENETDLLGKLSVGERRSGYVTNICDFGAFVDLGGVEGLLHISEMSWGRVNHPSDVMKSGDQLEVYIMDIDPQQRRIALSLKRLQPDPWSLVKERYQVGQLVEGTITNVVSFGAFARIEEGLEGLIHISELAEGDFLHPRNVVKEGEQVTVRIINIDGENHRLGLSLRQVFGWNGYSEPAP